MRQGSVVTRDGARVAFGAAGERHDDCVLFVHGNGASAGQFRREVEAYAEAFGTAAVSLRGHGGSRPPAGAGADAFTVEALARDAEAVLEHLGAGRAHVVGNSLGGLVAFELLAGAPQRVASLVTFGTTAALSTPRAAAAAILGIGRLLGRRGLAAVAGRQARPGAARAQVRRDLRQADVRAVAAIGRAIADYDHRATLRGHPVPWRDMMAATWVVRSRVRFAEHRSPGETARPRPPSEQEPLMREPTPTIADALAAIRSDPSARFAALLAGAFAFSAGFALGFALGARSEEDDAGPALADAAGPQG